MLQPFERSVNKMIEPTTVRGSEASEPVDPYSSEANMDGEIILESYRNDIEEKSITLPISRIKVTITIVIILNLLCGLDTTETNLLLHILLPLA